MRRLPFLLPRLAFLLAAAAASHAGPFTGTGQSSRLYTKPDPAAKGGIRVRLGGEGLPSGVFALPQTDWTRCYSATSGGGVYTFTGLPVGKYDLVVVYDDRFYEGLLLSLDPDTLTDRDRASIASIVAASVPFFDTKAVHRSGGTAGHAGKAAIVFQEVRTRPVMLQDATERRDIQIRSIKAGILEEVNIGWQLVNTREIMRIEAGGAMPKGLIRHAFVKELGNIRITDTIKDLGELRLN